MKKILAVFLTVAACLPFLCLAQTNTLAPKEPPVFTLYPACPCYHFIGESNGSTRIEARVNLAPSFAGGSVFSVKVFDSRQKLIQSVTTNAPHNGIAGVDITIPVQSAGRFEIITALLDDGGKVLGKGETDVHVAAHEKSVVQLGPDGFLRIGGKAEFPIGLYSSIKYEEIAKVGFMVAHNYSITLGEAEDPVNPYDMQLKQLLDKSWANGMRMMVELPRLAVEKGQWTQIRRRIETFRHHPGLLCWDSEERVARGKTSLETISNLYQLVHTEDPDHPFVLGDSRDLSKKMENRQRELFPENSMDIGIWWWYPIPLKDSQPLLNPPEWLTNTISKQPLWIAIQAYTGPWIHSRYPTPAEYRAQAYLSIINGVKALWFYTGSGEKDRNKKPAGMLDQPENSHWDYVQKLVRELREVSPVVLAPSGPTNFVLDPPEAPVEMTTRKLDGKLYLIAASKSVKAEKVRFNSPSLAGKQVEVLYEDHPVSAQGDTLADNFDPLGVHVYEIK